MLSFFESCSLDTLNSALGLFRAWKVVEITNKKAQIQQRSRKVDQVTRVVKLVAPYHVSVAET